MLAAGRDDEQLAALCLPPGYSELALKMPPPVRNLVVFNAEPSTVAVNDVLAGLGLPALRAAVDEASFSAADSVDGCTDYQLNLTRGELERLVDAHEIFVRRYTADTRPWFPFHRDRSELTVNVALADDELHGGGRLICLLDGAVKRVERTEGCATVHPSSFMHAVSRMTTGTRYSLIIFMGRSERIVAFNQEVRRLRHDGPS